MSSAERDEIMELVAAQAEEMSFIVEDLLVASRAELGLVSVAPTGVDLCAEVASSIESVGVDVAASCEKFHHAYADPGRVRQILRNLFTNIERYGGADARVVCGQTETRVWIEVRDNGEGVSPEDAQRIFEPYATAHTGVTSSVGLGLAVARQLAELMDGSLTYRRDRDESVFRLELPVSTASVPV